jgi:rare lipoprotein A
MNFTKTLFIILISALGFVPSFSQGLEYKKSFEGLASFYGKEFNGKTTANGDVFNSRYYTCAHRTLPFGTLIQIENPRNGKKVIVKVNDRGPFVGERVIDLSREAARKLGLIQHGVSDIKAKILKKRKGFDIITGTMIIENKWPQPTPSKDFHEKLFMNSSRGNLVLKI